jgi:predicted PurR-regulated permease PerM
MNKPELSQFSPIARTIIVLGALFLITLGLHQIASVVNTAFLAIVICITITPQVSWIKGRGLSNGLAVGITAILLVAFFLGVIYLILISWQNLIQYLPGLRETSKSQLAQLGSWFLARQIDISSLILLADKILGWFFTIMGSLLATLGSFLSILAFAVLASVFMLSEQTGFNKRLSNRFGSNQAMWANLIGFVGSTRSFIRTTTLMGILQGLIIAVVLFFIGVPFPLTWGLIFWLLNYIPYIGIWLAVIPPALIAGMEFGIPYALLVLLVYLVVRNVFSLLIYPRIMGEKVDISVTFGFLGLLFWGWTLGVFGFLLAYPYTLLVRDVFLNSASENTWLVQFMKSSKPIKDQEPKEEAGNPEPGQ